MFLNNTKKSVIILAVALIIFIMVGYFVANFISWIFHSESASDINLKNIDTMQLFKEKLGVTLIKEAQVKNVGKITVSGFSPDGTTISYYAKITLMENKLAEFKEKNYTSIEPNKLPESIYNNLLSNDFKWWNFSFEDAEYYLEKINPSVILIFCKPSNNRIDIYIADV